MSKEQKSKLDPFADRIEEWFLAGKTLAEAQEQLRQDGCSVSLSRLSSWWEQRQSARTQERLLGQIASSARNVKQVKEEFARNPSPGLEVIAKLNEVIAFHLTSRGAAEPELIDLSTKCTKMALDYAKIESKRVDQRLDERKVRVLEARAKQAEEAEAVAHGNLSAEEQASRLREIFKR